MRHIILSFIFSLTSCFAVSAQQGYFSLAGAYGFGNNGIVHSMFEQSVIKGNDITVVAKRLTLGTGLNYMGDMRYYFNDYFGLGLQGDLVRGSWQHFSSERKIVFIQHTSQSVRVRGFALSGAIHVRAGDNNITPYFSLFPGFFMGKMDLVDTITYSGQSVTSKWEYESLNTFFLSFASGIDFTVNKELNFFFEVEVQNMTVAPTKAKLIIRDGSDDLGEVPVAEKVIVFYDQIISDYTVQPDEDLPQKELKPYFPLDNFQIRIGCRIVLGR